MDNVMIEDYVSSRETRVKRQKTIEIRAEYKMDMIVKYGSGEYANTRIKATLQLPWRRGIEKTIDETIDPIHNLIDQLVIAKQ